MEIKFICKSFKPFENLYFERPFISKEKSKNINYIFLLIIYSKLASKAIGQKSNLCHHCLDNLELLYTLSLIYYSITFSICFSRIPFFICGILCLCCYINTSLLLDSFPAKSTAVTTYLYDVLAFNSLSIKLDSLF